MKEALSGLKVIDMCRSYPPAFASMFLADFGAEVIKIDTPGFSIPIPVKGGLEAFSGYFALDRNKKSISINLRSQEGRDIFLKLAAEADIFLENSTPGTMEKLGIDYPTMSEINPRIIYCSVSGYGQNGPYKMIPGHDSNYLGISGALSLIGEKDGPPIMPSNIIADMAGSAMYSLAGILIALQARERTGRGQYLDISYTDAVFSLLTFELSMYYLSGLPPRRGGTFRSGSEPFAASYKTKDEKYFNIACIEPRLWENLCRALGCEQFIPHQWTQDKKKKEEISSFLNEIFQTRTRDEWWAWAKDKQIAAGPVLELEEALEDPQIVHRQMALEVDHPSLGKVKQVGFPLKLSETPARLKEFAPRPGQHTEEILKTLGFSNKDIDDLEKQGAIAL